MKEKVKIFTEGGQDIGYGHISRCIALYEESLSSELYVEFYIFGEIDNDILNENYNIHYVNWLDEKFLTDNIKATDSCIVDSYLAEKKIYEVIHLRSKRTLFIDDNNRIEYPKGLILNPSLNVDSVDYDKSEIKRLIFGREYIILRKPFRIQEKRVVRSKIKDVLIIMGGSDIRNIIPQIIQNFCKAHPEINFHIVLGKSNILSKNIGFNNIEFYNKLSSNEMEGLMSSVDAAISAAGQTIYELISTQTPSILIKVIENQSNNIQGVKEIYPEQMVIKYNDDSFVTKLNKCFEKINQQSVREEAASCYYKQIDGLGAKRVIHKFLGDQL